MMEVALEYAIIAGILLLLPAAVQWKWSRRRALGLLGAMIGGLTFLYASIDWGGGPDRNMSRGFLVIGATIAAGLALLASMLMFIFNPPQPADDAERELGS